MQVCADIGADVRLADHGNMALLNRTSSGPESQPGGQETSHWRAPKEAPGEPGKLLRNGKEPVLTKSRWLLLKRPENLTCKQKGHLKNLLQYNPHR